MNFLAHIYLSNNSKKIEIGNFIADSVKGSDYLKFEKDIQIGILLHRAIDTFTDAHPIFKKSTKKLHKNYSHYSGVIVDILYDHFLAKNWKTYSETDLDVYIDNFYDNLQDHFEILPDRVQHLTPYLISDNWLLSYQSKKGIAKVLEGMNRRTKNKSKMNLAINELEEFYDEFESEFTIFFAELIDFSKYTLNELTQNISNGL